MNKIYKNWFVHNVIGHPVSEILYWVLKPFGEINASTTSVWFHDLTCPQKGHTDEGTKKPFPQYYGD
tara:strand:+ start:396 stop:596 length:201 start_codon:yes stop_codon:yes gene_type:complete